MTTIAARVASADSSLVKRMFAEIRDSFPVWFLLCMSGGHVLSALTFLQPPRYWALVTAILPLSWVAAYYRLRPSRARFDRPLVVSFCVAAIALTLLFWLPARLAWAIGGLPALRATFEVLAILWTLVLLLHCLRERGWGGVSLLFAVAAVYGFALENGGITLGYFSEAGYRFYVPLSRTPVSSVAGWCTIFYPSVFIADRLIERFPEWRGRVLWPSVLVTAVALSSDVHFDHLATALGMWIWNERLPAFFLGVPLVNYTSWLTAVFSFAALYYLVERKPRLARRKAGVALLAIPIVVGVAAIANLLLIGLLEGFSGPAWTIFREAIR